MSKKLSQAEIDALVASLLSGEAPAEEKSETPAQPEAVESAAPAPVAPVQDSLSAPEQPVPASEGVPAAITAPVVGLTLETMPFELIQDLGKITQAEVDAARMAYQNWKAGAPIIAEAPVPVAPVSAPAIPSPQPATAAAIMAPPAPAPSMAMPPSHNAYAASQAQAAQQTRRALSMAALSGLLMDIELTVAVELGSARLTLGDILALGPGSVVTLDKLANTPVDVLVNRLPMMKAEVLAIGEKYGVRVTQTSLNAKAAS